MSIIENIKIFNWLYNNKDSTIIQYGSKKNNKIPCKGYFIKNDKIFESKLYDSPFKVIKSFLQFK